MTFHLYKKYILGLTLEFIEPKKMLMAIADKAKFSKLFNSFLLKIFLTEDFLTE